MDAGALQVPDEVSRDYPSTRNDILARRMQSNLASEASSSESEIEDIRSSTESFDRKKEHRCSCTTQSHATKATQRAVRGLQKVRKDLGLKDLKSRNPLYRKVPSYQYYRLEYGDMTCN